MGKDSRRRRKAHRRRQRQERNTKALARVDGRETCRLRLTVEQLEIARGHDGLLRGMPEPTMLLGVYRVDAGRVVLMARYLYRFTCPKSLPCKVTPRDTSHESVVIPFDGSTRIVVLALAVEEDSGKAIPALYAHLQHGDGVVVWTEDDAAPVPIHLPELHATTLTPATGHRVQILFGEQDPSHIRGDDWIGASVAWMPAAARRLAHRFHFIAPDGRNDWTAQVMVAVDPA